MKRKDYVYGMKPYAWFKGSVLAFFGILLTRWGIGAGRVSFNIYYGLPIYFLIACSGMLIGLILKREGSLKDRIDKETKKLTISSFITYTVAFITSIFHTIYYNLDILNVFLLALFGAIYFIVFYYRISIKPRMLANILISLSSSFGIIYGASLNSFFIPLSIYSYFGAVFLLQLSKDLINEIKNKEKYRLAEAINIAETFSDDKIYKISLVLDLLVMILVILPFLLDTNLLYVISMVLFLIIIGFAALLTFLTRTGRKFNKLIKLLLQIGIFFIFAILLIASF